MKNLFTSILSLVLLFSMVGNVFAEGQKVNYEYSSALVQAVQLDEIFVEVVGLDGDFIVLDQQKAINKGISTDKIKEAETKIEDYNKITKDALEISPLLTFVGNQIEFDEKEAKKRGVSEELINATKSDIEKINKAAEEDISTYATCEGTNKFVDRWYGYDTYFNSCATTKIIGYVTVGAGITTVAAAITAFIAPPVGLVVGIAAGILGIGAGALTIASANGCGILIRWSLDKPIWTGSQC